MQAGMTAADIGAAGAPERRTLTEIKVDEWSTGMVVYIGLLSGHDTEIVLDYIAKQEAEEKSGSRSGEIRAMARIALIGLCDETGQPLFDATSDEAEDKLLRCPVLALKRILNVILKVNGISDEGHDELAKN